MKNVEKRGNVFCLIPDAAEHLADEARASHSQDCAVLESGSASVESITAILLHLASRLLILEQRM